ncbi:MAG: ATP-binding protein [Proteobacteria bacterium]|nr:ATP-binding protein [Pseudomonadota bacterium]
MKRRTIGLFVGVMVVVLTVELAAYVVERYLSSVEEQLRLTLSVAADQIVLVEKYERTSYLAVVGLATSDWELLLAQRNRAKMLSKRFADVNRALREGRAATQDGELQLQAVADLELRFDIDRVSALWREVVAGQVRLLRANNHELKNNPAVNEFRRRTAALIELLDDVIARLTARHESHIYWLARTRFAMPSAVLFVTLLLGLLALRGLVVPLGNAMDELQENRRQLQLAHEHLEQRVEERTQELAETNRLLHSQSEILESVLDGMGEGLMVASNEGSLHIWNAEASRIIGNLPDQKCSICTTANCSTAGEGGAKLADAAIWATLCESFHDDRTTPFVDDELPLQRALRGENVATEMFVRTAERPDGFWLSWTARPILTPNRELHGAVGVFRDETRRKQAEEHLQRAHDQLEQRVEERTRELRRIQHQLVDTALEAGRAEVATNILHNVGNVLNGVNVLTQVIRERLQVKQWETLPKIADLIAQHRDDLGRFFTEDKRGRQLPDFLAQFARLQQDERMGIVERVERLSEQIEHIKRIVHLQQEHAKAVTFAEDASVAAIIDNAISINQSALDRHGVTIVKHFEDLPALHLHKHKLLQILVNLVSNAKHAVSEPDHYDRTITIRLTRPSSDRIRIEVADNGIGIAPESHTRIFQHGYSTRKEGHGFGLHASVLAAQQMGGSLTAKSDGLGHGATFSLELPATPAKRHDSLDHG